MSVSVCLITHNEEHNLPRTLASIGWAQEIIIVDSGSTDQTCRIAQRSGARVFVEEWKGFAAQKNSALEKASCDWVLSLDADEEVTPELAASICSAISSTSADGFMIARRNQFLGRWIKHGGFYPDRKLRLWRRGRGRFQERPVHETAQVDGRIENLAGDLIHHAYPTLDLYLDHMNRYSTLGAQIPAHARYENLARFCSDVVLRPKLTFIYNYLFRLGFLDGREGLLLHLYHSAYVSWKYAKVWERTRK